jgi:transposase
VSTVEVVYERCAGLDVGKDEVVACIRVPDGAGGRRQEVHTYPTFSSGLESLAEWLQDHDVTQVVLEATGQYWKPIWYVLEERGLELLLVNARHVKLLPGRKTDVGDAAWLCELLEHGLLRGSFVPPAAIRELRDLTRYRKRPLPDPYRRGSAHPQDPGGRLHPARLGRRRRAWGLGPGDAAGAAGRRARPRGPH